MSSAFPPNRESFQKILAGAYAVQEYQMDRQSLSAYLEAQHLIASGELEGDAALQRIAECLRRVSGADGSAIGLVKANHVIYTAASGSAAPCVGTRLVAALHASADGARVREILRVENAEHDQRIGASICRQFAAQSLLMFVVQQEGRVAAVVQVLFSQPHDFAPREVRAYQLMAGLVDDALSTRKEEITAQFPAVPADIVAAPSDQRREAPVPRERWSYYGELINASLLRAKASSLAKASTLMSRLRFLAAEFPSADRLLHLSSRLLPSSVAVAMVAAAFLGLWIGYSHHRPAVHAPAQVAETANPEPPSLAQPLSTPGVSGFDRKHRELSGFGPAFRRVPVGNHEIDYVADDVTVRHFFSTAAARSKTPRYREVERGSDVTIRYFALNPASLSDPVPPPSPNKGR